MIEILPFQIIKVFIKKSWGKKTCFPPQNVFWEKTLPELGQCAVTALLVQDFLNGTIVFNKSLNHFWNLLPNGVQIDLTKNQFKNQTRITIDTVVPRELLLNARSARNQKVNARYELLKKRVQELIFEHQDQNKLKPKLSR